MAEIKVQGDSIHFITGESFDEALPTVLMVHGAGQSTSTWDYQLDLLRCYPKANFIIPDLPGHGKSGGEGCKTVNGYREFVKRFTDALGLKNIIFAGHSMGGGIAMLYALEHPEDVTACILVGTGVRLHVAEQTLQAAKNKYELFCDVAPTRAFAERSPQGLRDVFREGLLNIDRDVCYWDLAACDEFDIMEGIAKMDTRTMIISGSEDMLTPPKYGAHLHENIKDSVYHEIKDAGHFVMQEKHGEFNRVLSDFLDALAERS